MLPEMERFNVVNVQVRLTAPITFTNDAVNKKISDKFHDVLKEAVQEVEQVLKEWVVYEELMSWIVAGCMRTEVES